MGDLKDLRYTITARENLSGKLDRVTGASNRTNRALGTQNRHLSSLKKNISSAASQLPFFSNAMGLVSNPILLATGAGVGFIAMLSSAKNAAAEFNSEFRELYNLNLDKTPLGIANMKSMVLNTAFDKGFNANQTSTAYYDVQSIAGVEGLKAKSLIEKTGMFSRVMQSDFNATIAGTAQVMDIYGMKVKDVDKYLESMFSTVMVGKTTFDEMSKVQVEYAGAAFAAGQGSNEANKIFAAFSKTTKSVEIAATMTKTAFQDLTKKSTLAGFDKLGVSVYDAENKMLSVDVILQNLIPRLQSMDDKTFGNLKEEIGGSEGLKGLLDLAKTKADGLLESFELFDNSGMDYGKALREFNKDATELNKTLKNQIGIIQAEIGQDVLPAYNSIQKRNIEFLKNLRDVTSGNLKWYDKLVVDLPLIWNPYAKKSQARIDMKNNKQSFEEYQSTRYKDLMKNASPFQVEDAKGNKTRLGKDAYESQLRKFNDEFMFFQKGVSSSKDDLTWVLMKAGMEAAQNAQKDYIDEYVNTPLFVKKPDPDPNTTIEGDLAKKTIGSIGSKTINITIEKFQDEININGTSFTETNDEMVQQMEEGFLRVLQGVEEAYG